LTPVLDTMAGVVQANAGGAKAVSMMLAMIERRRTTQTLQASSATT
jgi:hypothetical protein